MTGQPSRLRMWLIRWRRWRRRQRAIETMNVLQFAVADLIVGLLVFAGIVVLLLLAARVHQIDHRRGDTTITIRVRPDAASRPRHP